jgi:hypothetical protein
MQPRNSATRADASVPEAKQADGVASPGRRLRAAGTKALPPELRTEFDSRLNSGAFSDYRGISLWLRKRGYRIGHLAPAPSGRALDCRLEALRLATEQARAVVHAAEGADDLVNEGLMRLVQGDLFRVLVEVKEIDPEKVDINALARNVASICRSAVSMRKAAEQMQRGIGKRVLAAERKVMAAARRASRGGLSRAAEQQIRAALLEITELPAQADEANGVTAAQGPLRRADLQAGAPENLDLSAAAETAPGETT